MVSDVITGYLCLSAASIVLWSKLTHRVKVGVLNVANFCGRCGALGCRGRCGTLGCRGFRYIVVARPAHSCMRSLSTDAKTTTAVFDGQPDMRSQECDLNSAHRGQMPPKRKSRERLQMSLVSPCAAAARTLVALLMMAGWRMSAAQTAATAPPGNSQYVHDDEEYVSSLQRWRGTF